MSREGHRVSNRLGVWWDEDMDHWVILGRHETDAATGSAQEMVLCWPRSSWRTSRTKARRPWMEPAGEREALPEAASDLLARAVEPARFGAGGIEPHGGARPGGGLMAAALHLLSNSRDGGMYALRPVGLSFGMSSDEPADEPEREASQ